MTEGLYFEDYQIDQEIESRGRTITEGDIVNFSGLTGDWVEIHINDVYAKSTPFGERIAHGLLTMSVASGLIALTGILERKIIAFIGINNWEFKRPVKIGDTISTTLKVLDKEKIELKNGLKAGYVTFSVQIKNQKKKICQDGSWKVMVKSKEAQEN